jgi:cytochrome c biogenesis protein CcmG/thiol:disulfide interchange protein DsbE
VLRKLLLFALILGLAGCYSSSRPTHIGTVAPDFTVQDGDRTVTLHDLRGQVVILNFWATWCPPCIEETPSMVAMAQRMKPQGVTVLGVSIDEDANAYHNFLKQYGVDFLTVRDPGQKASALYGTTGWPETFIIDRKGVVRRKFIGAVDWNDPEIVKYLTNL